MPNKKKYRITLSLEKRLRFTLIIATLLVISIGGISYFYITNLNDKINYIIDRDVALIKQAQTIKDTFHKLSNNNKDLSLSYEEFLIYIKTKNITGSEDNKNLKIDKQVDNITELVNELMKISKFGKEQSFDKKIRNTYKKLEKNLLAYNKKIISLNQIETNYYSNDEKLVQKEEKQINKQVDNITTKMKTIKKQIDNIKELNELNDTDKERIGKLNDEYSNFDIELKNLKYDLTKLKDPEKGVRLVKPDKDIKNEFVSICSKLKKIINEIKTDINIIHKNRLISLSGHEKEIKDAGKNSLESMIVILLTSIIAGILITLIAPQNVTMPLKRLITLINGIKDGHYNISRKLETQDDVGLVFKSLHSLIKVLDDLDTQKRNLIAVLEKRFQLIANHFEPIIIVDVNMEIIFCNQSFYDVFNYNKTEIIHRNLNHIDLDQKLKENLKESLDKRERLDRKSIEIEVRTNEPNVKKQKKTNISTYFLRNYHGEISEVMTIVEDIKTKIF